MSCVGLHTGGGIAVRTNRVSDPVNTPGLNRVRVGSTRTTCCPTNAAVVKCSAAAAAIAPLEVGQGGTHMRGGPEKFDHWMKESVGEIVKNLREAPLFVHVYGGGGGGPETRLKAERAVADDWSHLKGKWVKGEEPSPEGIILVEELKEGDVEVLEESEGQNGDCTKAWGVLIQGKGEDGGVACYLLKTSQVGCGNLGVFCTHYCLVRVKNFRETARSQLTSWWLV